MVNKTLLMKLILSIILFFLVKFTNAQTWNSLIYNANQPGLTTNPLKGFVDLYNPANNFPRSIDAKLFGLNSVMTGLNNFNWTVIDNFLAQGAALGHHSYIQVNIDPGSGNSYMPTFLLGSVAFENFPGDSVNIADNCPDWNNPLLMNAMLNFISAFGAKYNNDPRVFMVHLGLYGIFGEWHIGYVENIRPEFVMTEANKLLIANAYSLAFPNKSLLARYPENMPDPQTFGYSDGLFFGQSLSNTNSYYFHNILKASQANKNWKLYPIGGEIDPSLQDSIWKVSPNLIGQDVQICFDSIHPTWLFSHHIFTAMQPNTAEWDNALNAQKKMGYTFFVKNYRLSALNGKPAIEVNIQNKGIAPMYANWDVEFGVINSSNQFQSLGTTKWNLDIIQPSIQDNYRSFISNITLPNGTYTAMLRVKNPLSSISSNANLVRFANTTQDSNSVGWLTLGNLIINSGNAGLVPIKVTGVSLSITSDTIEIGNSLLLSANVLPANATNNSITWISDHPGTASVDENGLVTAGNKTGNAIVKAITQDGGFIANCTIRVDTTRYAIPAKIEAEYFAYMQGIQVENCNEGGLNVGYIDDEDWMVYSLKVDSSTFFKIDYRVASQSANGKITLIKGTHDTLHTIQIPNTNGWQNFATITSSILYLPAGKYNLKLVATKGAFNLNWLEFKYLPTSFTFLGATDNKFETGANWNVGYAPPAGFRGTITFQGNCLKNSGPFITGNGGKVYVNKNFTIQ